MRKSSPYKYWATHGTQPDTSQDPEDENVRQRHQATQDRIWKVVAVKWSSVTGKRETSCPFFKMVKRRTPGHYWPISLTSMPVKLWKRSSWKMYQDKRRQRDIKYGYTKRKCCQTNLLTVTVSGQGKSNSRSMQTSVRPSAWSLTTFLPQNWQDMCLTDVLLEE